MRITFSPIAHADISEAQVVGSGGAAAPVLSIPLRLTVQDATLPRRYGWEVVSLACKLSVADTILCASAPRLVGFIVPHGYLSYLDQLHYLEFPLDAVRIHTLEKARAGGDMNVALNIELVLKKIFELVPAPAGQPLADVVWGHISSSPLYVQTQLTIPRDVWISRVLPNVGHGVVQVVEFPAAPIESCKRLDHSFKALNQAHEMHRMGQYDDAAGKCRVALDPFFEYVDKQEMDKETEQLVVRRIPRLKKTWETQLGAAAYAWLDQTTGAIKDAANRPHHSPNAHYSQFDSQMILAITTAVVAYVARTVDWEDKK